MLSFISSSTQQRNKLSKLFLFLILYLIAEPVNAQCWQKVFTGWNHTFAIMADSTLWAWGANESGELGVGSTERLNFPIVVSASKDWMSVSLGLKHTLGLKKDGTLWAWGSNQEGQLGDSNFAMSAVPVQIDTAKDWAYISAGLIHSMGIKTDGTLWAWGDNIYYQLGDGTRDESKVPKQIGTDANWKSISSLGTFVMGIKTDGTLWGWGSNSYGQVGLGDPSLPYKTMPVQVGTDNDWKEVIAANEYCLALKTDSTLWSWGANYNGQLGLGEGVASIIPTAFNNNQKWKSIAAGGSCSSGIRDDGTLWAWGRNVEGYLGVGDPVLSTSYVWQPLQIGTGTNWQTISCKLWTSAGITNDHVLYQWGANGNSQVGDGSTVNRTSPVKINCYELLPVHFISFTATKQPTAVVLNWVTDMEINTKEYRLEQSGNGVDFHTVSTTKPKNGNVENRYQFTDFQPKRGWNYYRLKIVDTDERFSYSNTRAIDFKPGELAVTPFPNPVNDLLFIKNSFAADNNIVIKITDMAGRTLLLKTIFNNKIPEISVGFLKTGIYMITVSDTNNSVTNKIGKQ